tara:strand:- start:5440 stop:5895 length:456 start_codon:yes stop_codon:yes gene_type:complete
VPLHRTRHRPARRHLRRKAEAAVIFGIADQHDRAPPHRIGRRDRGFHECGAYARALQALRDRNRAEQRQGMNAVRCREFDRPELDRAHKRAIRIQRHKAETIQRAHAFAQAIGRAAVPVGAENVVEKRFNGSAVPGAGGHDNHVRNFQAFE